MMISALQEENRSIRDDVTQGRMNTMTIKG